MEVDSSIFSLDSGADDWLFPLEVARALRIDLAKKQSQQYGGIGAGEVKALFETVTIEVGGWPFSVPVGFSDSPKWFLRSLRYPFQSV
jgi:hypothetical protein